MKGARDHDFARRQPGRSRGAHNSDLVRWLLARPGARRRTNNMDASYWRL
jgi:hypothetical protein